MPVEDHPVHEKTKVGADFKYGCNNRAPFKDSYIGSPWSKAVVIKHVMSTDCRYDLATKDSGCFGCKWINRALCGDA